MSIKLAESHSVLGWIGGYVSCARGWELHPRVVHPRVQGRGIGRVRDGFRGAGLGTWEPHDAPRQP